MKNVIYNFTDGVLSPNNPGDNVNATYHNVLEITGATALLHIKIYISITTPTKGYI